MISADHLRRIAFWSHDLTDAEFERARRGVVEKSYAKGAYVCHRGDRLDSWTGVAEGLLKIASMSRSGKAVTLAGIRTHGWFGEGTVLKHEARQYDLVALRDTRLALMDRATFLWLFENSVGFNRFLVRQLNERLGQFIGMLEVNRTLDATSRLARSIASLFNPILYPESTAHLEITQEEIGALSGMSRQNANRALNRLEKEGLLRLEYGGVTILNVERLRGYGD